MLAGWRVNMLCLNLVISFLLRQSSRPLLSWRQVFWPARRSVYLQTRMNFTVARVAAIAAAATVAAATAWMILSDPRTSTSPRQPLRRDPPKQHLLLWRTAWCLPEITIHSVKWWLSPTSRTLPLSCVQGKRPRPLSLRDSPSRRPAENGNEFLRVYSLIMGTWTYKITYFHTD